MSNKIKEYKKRKCVQNYEFNNKKCNEKRVQISTLFYLTNLIYATTIFVKSLSASRLFTWLSIEPEITT